MSTSRDDLYEPDHVFPPGETLTELLDELDMTQSELATRTGLSTKHINQIVNGAAPITPDTALLLERVTGVPARAWGNLEVAYREFLSRQEDSTRLENDLSWLQELPIKELEKRGLIAKRHEPVATVGEVCRFFGVANRATWVALWNKPTAYRVSTAFTSDPGAVAAWLRIGELRAVGSECSPFDKTALAEALPQLRALTRVPDPADWWPRLRATCAAAGVIVVLEPDIPGARINGAARWLAPDKALIQLSVRHRWNDIFWFTLFHEVGHLLLHSKKDTFINDPGRHSGVEAEADAFAAQTLIPRRYEADLAACQTVEQAREFADRIGIAPANVVGRLQHDGRWAHSKGNGLKQRFFFKT